MNRDKLILHAFIGTMIATLLFIATAAFASIQIKAVAYEMNKLNNILLEVNP